MAHHNKFVSVNLNKSYGPSNPNRPRSSATSGTYSAGAGGMVVLSRPRSSSSSQTSKLSVPPPLNLPSLRKESEKFDLANLSNSIRPGSSGTGIGSGSGSVGWTKPTNPIKPATAVEPRVGSVLSGEEFPSLNSAVNLPKESTSEKKVDFSYSSPLKMAPQGRTSTTVNSSSSSGSNTIDRHSSHEKYERKEEKSSISQALPYVKLTHTSDWADDERDTGLSLPERDHGFSGGEFESNDFYKNDSFGRSDLIGSSKNGSSWRDESGGVSIGSVDTRYARRDLGYGTNLQNRRSVVEGYRGNNGDFMNGGYNNNNRNKGNTFQHNVAQKGPYSFGTKAFSFNDSMLNYGKETRVNYSPKIDLGLDITDPFSDDPIEGVNLKVYMKKKEAEKQLEFHDPIRESFEAELERVQRAQEQERRKHMEQQEREVELIRREQEERERLAREEEERRRSMDEEAREASWRAEQERIEAARRAEEQKIAREEEKRRLAMEEERRKEAARRKLMELEEKIARRQSENNTQKQRGSGNEQASNDVVNWEDGERMVDHITNTTSSGLVMNNKFNNTFVDRGKQVNCWKRDAPDDGTNSSLLLSQDQVSDYHGLGRDNNYFNPASSFQRNDSFNRFGAGTMRGTFNGSGNSELSTGTDDFRYVKGNQWNSEGGQYTRNIEVDVAEFLDNNERFKGYSTSYNEVEGGFSKFNRSRYATGQPRVLPPPIIQSTRQSQSTIRDTHDHHSSSFIEDQSIMQFQVRPGTQDLIESDVVSSEKRGKDSPRCDSQSSLSVSNPPCSPTQLSHDEFDEVEKDISGEEQTVPSEELLAENINGEEEDDWPIENREEIQEHEKYEEDDNDNDEPQNDEIVNVHDGIDDTKSLDLNDNFNDQNAEKAIQEMGQFVNMHMNDDADGNLEKTIEENSGDDTKTSILIKETKNDFDNSVADPAISTSDTQVTTTSLGMPVTSSNVNSQIEAPVTLQFGLFSSPPLLSSPIPAIQIGTIQMPLNLLPPIVQFGQLKYPSPLPLTPQNLSFIQPSTATHNLVVSRINQEIRNATLQNNVAKKLPSSTTEEKLPLGISNKEVNAQAQIDPRVNDNGSRLNSGNQNVNLRRNYRPVINNRESHVYYGETQSSNRSSVIKSGNNGRKVAYAVKNASTRSSFPMQESHRTDSTTYQRKLRKIVRRTEFRIRESLDKRQAVDMESNIGQKDACMSKSTELPTEPNIEQNELNAASSSSQITTSDGKEGPSKKRVSSIDSSQDEGNNGKKILSIEEDVDVPLQSGVVCVFNQPGIEALSDDDNFIQVKSKRQMLIDRREKREREVKAKAKVIKAPRKNHVHQRFSVRSNSTIGNSKSQGTKHQVVHTNVISNSGVSNNVEAALTSPALPPIGTPTVKVDSDTRSSKLMSKQVNTTPDPPNPAAKFVPGLSFDNKNIGLDNASLPLGSWSTPDINQQVMALTQSQLDDAMTPVQYDCQMTSTCLPSTSAIAPEKHSPPNHLSSLLGGERIQFGAVDLASSNNKSSSHLEDADSEAEAAASAVAVAAISNNDESIPGSKSFSSKDNTESKNSAGLASDQEVTAQSSTEESIAVSLPADLTVDTHTIPSWHPLPSPQNTSGLPLSHFSTGAHTHFPLGFDMNPIFGGPVFTFGPHDESSGTQSQPQRSTAIGAGPIGSWPTDSFYGPHTGFSGPYISPPRVEAPHHMVVYNHFAPIGQFSQVGLSFMGTTYVPNEKQPDLKHNPISSSSSVVVSEGDASNSNVRLNAPVQHLATMPSPLPISNMPPFKPSLDIAYQGQWSHVAPPPIHSNSHSMPVQQQQQQHQPRQAESGKDRYEAPVQNESDAQIIRSSLNQAGSTSSVSTKVSNTAKNTRHVGSGYRDHQRSGPAEQPVGYQGRAQVPAASGKSSRMKQIYVPKAPALSRPTTTS